MSKKTNNQLVVNVLEGIIIIVLGILIAVCGIDTTVNIYFGVLALVIGVAAGIFAIYLLSKEGVMPLGITLLSGALIAIGIGLFANYISFGVFINLLILVLLGAGTALIVHGIYFLAKVNKLGGVIQIIVGAALVTLTALYINVPDFVKAFWIIVGILIAIYGAFSIIYAVANKK